MELKTRQAIRDFLQIADDTTDAYINYLTQKDQIRKDLAYSIYQRLSIKRKEALKKMNQLIKKYVR